MKNATQGGEKILLLGGNGLIGSTILRALTDNDYAVSALVRSSIPADGNSDFVDWIQADLRQMKRADDWEPILDTVDTVVNASGALQSGALDDLAAVQRDSIVALVDACGRASVERFVQISAPGADPNSELEFLRTKGEADDHLRQSGLRWVILKPGLVISPTAYGGTSLLRMLAGFPVIQPLVMPQSPVQCVSVNAVSGAVLRALRDPQLAIRDFDLVEPEPRSLLETVLAFRRWLGFAEPIRIIALPDWLGMAVARLADIAGYLGWRSPLRSTALKVMAGGVTADPKPWQEATDETLPCLPDLLDQMPSTLQERIFSRARLLFPLLVVGFSLFWVASGLIGLINRQAAESVVSGSIGTGPAGFAVIAGSVLDIAVGLGLLVRRWFRAACLGAIILSVSYLAAGTWITPQIWADPLGPFVKVIPVLLLAFVLITLAEER